MSLDLSTEIWMGGVLVFGVVFYFISMFYAEHSEDDEQKLVVHGVNNSEWPF